MLVLDLDGTALVGGQHVREDDVLAAHALANAGIPVTIATGRLFRGSVVHARALGVQGAIAVMNGSELVDVQTEEVRFGRYLGLPARQAIRQILADHNLDPVLFGGDMIRYCPRVGLADYLRTWTPELTQHAALSTEDWHADRVVAIAGCGSGEAVRAAAAFVRQSVPDARPSVFATWQGDGFLELRADGDDKGTGVERLAAERGFAAGDCVVVGDWINDLPMLRSAGLSFAMGGAAPEAIDAAHAELDARRGEGGGVVEVAERVWGIRI
jgi:hypothetical protein